MSAESPRRGSRSGGVIVRPQPVSDKSVMASVVDFFQDVAYSNPPKGDDREKIQWVRFEQTDINDINSNPDVNPQSGNTAPMLLILGYTNGFQIWSIPASGEAQEMLSLRQGPVKLLRLLPQPEPVFGRTDGFAPKRPLITMCDRTSAGQPYCCIKFVSMRTGDEVHNISFSYTICDIQCNKRVVVVAFSERIAVFDSSQFKQLFWITSCYPGPGPNPNPIALGTRWLAYADKKLVPVHQTCGGMTGDGGQSYAATVISAAKTITKGLTVFSETVSSLAGVKPPQPTVKKDSTAKEHNGSKPGVVTIVDVQTVGEGQISLQEDTDGEGLIAHFPAHATEPVSAMKFDPSGTMLLTTDRLGHNFHLFRIMAHPWSCSLGAVHHLYTLYRGDTTAKVQDISFTRDSRWVALTTQRGTTHVFPITTYGGPVTVRTHTSRRVVNRASRFQRSAGLEDIEARVSGRDSPAPTVSPSSSPGRHEHYRHLSMNIINNNFNNPRLPPFPHPTTVTPLVQIKQVLSIPGLGNPTSGSAKAVSAAQTVTTGSKESICVATCFACSRGWVAGSPSIAREKSDDNKAMDSLYIVNWNGNLVEYILEPRAKPGADKMTEESPLEVAETPRAQWILGRCVSSPEVRLPLPSNSPLIQACEAVMYQRPTSADYGSQGMGSRQESKESLSSDHSLKEEAEDQWLSQVEIITHAGPHRRLWMGPQFSFKTFQGSGTTTVLASNSSVLLSHSPTDGAQHVSTMDIVSEDVDLQSLKITPARSSPVAMPGSRRGQRLSSTGSDNYQPSPTFIEAGSYEQSPSVIEGSSGCWSDVQAPVVSGEMAEDQLKEHLADAMAETPVKQRCGPTSRDLERGSLDNLSTSSGSASSAARGHSFDARTSPLQCVEHVLVFPCQGGGSNGSPGDSN